LTRTALLALPLTLLTSSVPPEALAADKPAEGLTVTKELVYTVPDGVKALGSPVWASGSSRWACVCRRDDKRFVVLDGAPEKAYDEVRHLEFSPSGRRFAYVATLGEKDLVVLDGSEQKPCDEVALIGFDRRRERLAYAAWTDHESAILLDGIPRTAPGNAGESPTFSPDGRRFATADTTHDRLAWWVVLDGTRGEAYDLVGDLRFSPDSRRFAYAAMLGHDPLKGKEFMILDGVRRKVYDSVWEPTFSPDSRRFAYAAASYSDESDAREFVVLDGVKQTACRHVWDPTFSPDSRRFAYALSPGHLVFVVLDGVHHRPYDYAWELTFSSDSKHFAYAAESGDKSFVVVDGEPRQKLDRVGCVRSGDGTDGALFVWYGWVGEWALIEVGDEDIPHLEPAWFLPGSKLYRFTARIGEGED
jgi:WD40 repeat protein